MILVSNPLIRDGRILIEPDVLGVLDRFRQRDLSTREAGGILLGYRRGIHLHVVDLTTPHSNDTRRRTGFHRESNEHQRVALARWSASGGVMDYLGEWHTHPERAPVPSAIDRNEWKVIVADRTTPMLFLILGTMGLPWLGVGARMQFERVQIPDQSTKIS